MPERIPAFLSTKSSAECARLLGSARHYIHNDQLINLLQNFDVNNPKKNMKFKNQLVSFSTVPGLQIEVTTWLNS